MLTDAPAIPLDLLVVGGLTIDHFADGLRTPGGSVLHAARAAAMGGERVGAVTLAGPEPEARDGLRELARLAELHVEPAPASISFAHDDAPSGRRLRFLGGAGLLACPARAFRPAAVLWAPVADELGAGMGGQRYAGAVTGAILQGWLRLLEAGNAVRPLPLTAIPDPVRTVLASCAALVASVEDLAAEGTDPERQLDALRATFGAGPGLVVTAGEDGALLDAGGVRARVSVASLVRGASTVGAGDAFATGVMLGLGRGQDLAGAAAGGSRLAAAFLATGRAAAQ